MTRAIKTVHYLKTLLNVSVWLVFMLAIWMSCGFWQTHLCPLTFAICQMGKGREERFRWFMEKEWTLSFEIGSLWSFEEKKVEQVDAWRCWKLSKKTGVLKRFLRLSKTSKLLPTSFTFSQQVPNSYKQPKLSQSFETCNNLDSRFIHLHKVTLPPSPLKLHRSNRIHT
jgi:hypothetical protein